MFKEIKEAPAYLSSRCHVIVLALICVACAEQPLISKPPTINSSIQKESYAQKLAKKIKSNTFFKVPNGLVENDPVEYEVTLHVDGTVESVNKIKSSSVPGFDDAVRQAIDRSQPFPADNAGIVPSSFIFSHRPKSTEAIQKNAQPIYPSLSVQMHEQGTTALRVFVNEIGAVKEIQIKTSSGYPRLDQAAMDTVKNWRFTPGKVDGHASETSVVVPINFKLAENEKIESREGIPQSEITKDQSQQNGMFQLILVKDDYAEFIFKGFNEKRGNWLERYTVERGVAPDIQNAIVSKMVDIIAETKVNDFLWDSPRLGMIKLRADPQFRSETKKFLLHEFFPDYKP